MYEYVVGLYPSPLAAETRMNELAQERWEPIHFSERQSSQLLVVYRRPKA